MQELENTASLCRSDVGLLLTSSLYLSPDETALLEPVFPPKQPLAPDGSLKIAYFVLERLLETD